MKRRVNAWLAIAIPAVIFACFTSASTGAQSPTSDADAIGRATQSLRAGSPIVAPGQTATLLSDGRWLILGGVGLDMKPSRGGVVRLVGASDQTADTPVEMLVARTGHTATVLTDGSVLVLGGVDLDGHVVRAAETLDGATLTFSRVENPAVLPRAFHTTTLLTDGRLLITGGIGINGTVLDDAEVFDPFDNRVERFNARLETARFGHFAALLPTAPVVLWGGFGQDRRALEGGEVFDPTSRSFSPLTQRNRHLLLQEGDESALPFVAESLPPGNATGVPVDQVVSVRFSKPMSVSTLDESTVTVFGPNGTIAVDVVPAEAGLLVFVTPQGDLLPDSDYTLFVSGASDLAGRPLPFTAVGFHTGSIGMAGGVHVTPSVPTTSYVGGTQGQGPSIVSSWKPNDTAPPSKPAESNTTMSNGAGVGSRAAFETDVDEIWNPTQYDYDTGAWTTNRDFSERDPRKLAVSTRRIAVKDTTALVGTVLKLNDRPLVGVTLRIGGRAAKSDGNGAFLIDDVPAGKQTLAIDGTSAGDYGFYETVVFIEKGKTNVVPHLIWLPLLDRENIARIPSPTLSEVVLTTPRMPGFSVIIPPGVVIRDRSGKIVTQLGITPIPVDRTPFPLPDIYQFDAYYTIQPAGATLESVDGKPVRARVIYPNYGNVDPNRKMLFWNHDPVERGWHIYGNGRVSEDGQRIVPDQNVGIYQFSGFMVSTQGSPPSTPCPCGAPGGNGVGAGSGAGSPGVPFAGDPVNLATGSYVYTHTDLVVNDIMPLALRRTYFTMDQAGTREFGLGMSSGMDYLLYNQYPNGLEGPIGTLGLTVPDGGNVDLVCVQSCSYLRTGVFEGATPGPFYKSVLTFSNSGPYPLEWTLLTKDGTRYVFYADGGKIKYIVDRYGNRTTFTRTPYLKGRLTSVTSPNGKSIELSYQGNLIIGARDNLGRSWAYTYTTVLGNNAALSTATDPMGGVWKYTYDPSWGVMDTVTDPLGKVVVRNEYATSIVPTKQTYADGTSTSYAWTWDAGHTAPQQVDVTDKRGNVRRVVFGPRYYVASDTFALGKPEAQTTTVVRDPATKLISSETDPLGRLSRFTYDTSGNVTSITRLSATPNAVTTTFTYEPQFSQVLSITDPLGHVQTNSYDSLGNKISVTDANGNSTSMSYTSTGQLASVTDALGHAIQYGYDGGNVASLTDALGRTSKVTYDRVGRTTSSTNPFGDQVSVSYDDLDRVVRVTDPLGNVVLATYDANGNLLTLADQLGHTTSFSYDAANRAISKTDGLGRVESYIYEAGAILKQVVNRKSEVTTFEYDALNRLVKTGFGATISAINSPDSTINRTYDGGGQILSLVDSRNGAIYRTYDAFSRVQTETTSGGTLTYSYDAAGRRLSMNINGQRNVAYDYDAANRLSSIQNGTATLSFAYDVANRRTGVTLPNGIVETVGYDNANQLSSLTYKSGAANVGDLQYVYDGAGRRTSATGSLSSTLLPENAASTLYGLTNQQTAWRARSVQYDLNGNLVDDGQYTYVWNSRGQLVQVMQSASVVAAFSYDAAGRRAAKTVLGSTTRFLYDGSNFVAELDSSGVVKAQVFTGMVADEVYGRDDGGTVVSFLKDNLGSVVAETDAARNIVTTYAYEPYGATTSNGQISKNSQRFTAREQDLDSLYYYRARYYSTETGRFISEDPAGTKGGLDLYAYAWGNPISYSDPLGLRPLTAYEKCKLKPYIPQTDLDNADLHDGDVPWWFLNKNYAGVTLYNDIYFRPGVYDGSTASGIGLLGHELVHVGQYRNGMTEPSYLWSTRDGYMNSPYEKEAYSLEKTIVNDLINNPGGSASCGCQQ